MRVFLGLSEVAGYYSGLKKGFDEIGVEANFVTLRDHRFKYHANETSNLLIKAIKRVNRYAPEDGRLKALSRKLLFKLLLVPLFIWALFKHDVFIFGQMSTFHNFMELPIIKFFGKKVIHVFHGGDTRPPYICGSFVLTFKDWSIERWIEYTRQRKEALKKIERYSDALVADLAFAQLAERPCVSYFRLGIPLVPNGIDSIKASEERGVPRIIHCPSDSALKGTARIREAIANLQAKGYQLEYVEITNQPNRVVLEEIAKSDFAIDQLYSDTPMASLPTEAALLGKPTIVGGYEAERIKQALGIEADPPSLFCQPEEIEKAIETLLRDVEFRRELGRRARSHVEENWTPRQVAERYLRLISGDIPQGWMFDPNLTRHVHGCGLSEEKAKEMIRNMVEHGGRASLQLSDKPELEARLVEFAYSSTER